MARRRLGRRRGAAGGGTGSGGSALEVGMVLQGGREGQSRGRGVAWSDRADEWYSWPRLDKDGRAEGGDGGRGDSGWWKRADE